MFVAVVGEPKKGIKTSYMIHMQVREQKMVDSSYL